MLRLLLAGTVSGFAVLANPAPVAAQPPAGAYGAVVVERSPALAWAMSVALSETRSAPASFAVTPGEPHSIPLADGSGDTLVCGGAEHCATVCSVLHEGQDLAFLRLVNGVQVRGRVLLGRAPVSDGRVYLRFGDVESRRPLAVPLSRSNTGAVATSVATDANGFFDFEHVAPGRYAAEVHLNDGRIYEGDPFHVPSADDRRIESMNLPVITVPPGLQSTIHVRDRDGQPIAGAGVGLLQRQGWEIAFLAEMKTGTDGAATVSGLDFALPVHVTCSARGFVRLEQRLPVPPTAHECVLVRFGTVSGRVVAKDGAPLRATVTDRSEESRSTNTEDDGTFRLSGIPAGDRQLRVTAKGYRAAFPSVVVDERGETDAGAIELTEADAVSGQVIDAESSAPIEGATVAALEPPQGVVTDHEGRFTMTVDLSSGARLETSAPGYAVHTSDVTAARPRNPIIALQRAGQLEATVWNDDGDAPCAGCTVSISSAYVAHSARTDGKGVARFADLAPGQYQVAREHVTSGAAVVHVSSGSSVRIVYVKPRETARVELGTRKRVIEVVLSPNPPPDCWLSAVSRGTAVSGKPNGAFGSYRLAVLSGETYRLQLSCGASGARIGVIPSEFDGSSFRVQLGTSAVIGSVSLDRQRPGGNGITLRSLEGTVVGWATPQPDGGFVIPYLVAGAYALEVGSASTPFPVAVSGGTTDVGRLP